jgi:hypothetical protein
MTITNGCCDVQCDFRIDRVRQILAAIDVSKVTGVPDTVLARSVLNPRGERTIGRVGIDTSNADEDAALDVITVKQAMSTLPSNATAEQIARACCPYAVPVQKEENVGPDTRTTSEPVSHSLH